MISYKNALKLLYKSKIKIKSEKILLKNSLYRICSENIYSKSNYPATNNTALDGFAINSVETTKLKKNKYAKFKVLKTLVAGDKPDIEKIKKGYCIEVMTGTSIKKPFDTIIPYEESYVVKENNSKYLLINKKIKKFNHLRFVGSDFKKGQIVVRKGDLIKASDILALKTLGIKNIKVRKKINVVFYPTGNEISNKEFVPLWKVRNSNGDYIKSFARILPIKFKEEKILKDNDEKKFEKEIKKCIKKNIDIIMTIGGVSAGRHDFIPKIVNKFKTKYKFKNKKIRPGKPILFSKLNTKTVFFGLPGNPISTAACFRFFVLPFIFKSIEYLGTKPIAAKLNSTFKKDKNFTRFIKGVLKISKKGFSEFSVLKGQESYRIKPLLISNVWGQFNQGKSSFNKGDIIECHTTFGVNFL